MSAIGGRPMPRLPRVMPVGEARHPVTGTNWEGVGVQPNVAVPADRALETALLLAG